MYHIARNNQQLGAFSKEETINRYNRGEFLPSDLVWTDGMANWQPASQVFGAPQPPAFANEISPAAQAAMPLHGSFDQTQLQARPPRPNSGLIPSIIALVLSVFSCNFITLIAAIVATVFATQVNKKYDSGDYAGAKSTGENATIIAWISLVLCVLLFIIFFSIGFARGFAEAMQQRGH